MDRWVRLAFLAVFVLLSIYRFIRYSKAATSKTPPAAIPGTGGVPPPVSQTPPASQAPPVPPDATWPPATSGAAAATTPAAMSRTAAVSPIADDAAGRSVFALGAQAALAAVVVWLAGNAVLWLALFGIPPLNQVPMIWRLVAGVLANFYLMRLARSVAVRIATRVPQPPSTPGGNPFPP